MPSKEKAASIAHITTALKKFKFAGTTANADVPMKLVESVDLRYENYAILKQIKRMLILPYLIIFSTNGTIILRPFVEVFELLKIHLAERIREFDVENCRIVINDRMIILDFFPTAKIRRIAKLYSMHPNEILLNNENIEELNYFEEVEVINTETNLKLSKNVR